MDDLHETLVKMNAGLDCLQDVQKAYDSVGWMISDPPFEKYRHISIHLMMIVGELAKHTEAGEHVAANSGGKTSGVDLSKAEKDIRFAVANMLFHAAQLANLAGIKCNDCLTELYATNAKRFAPSSAFAKLEVGPAGTQTRL